MKIRSFLLAMMLCALCVTQASALEYDFDAPEDYLFGQPTSDDTIYEWENPNVDRSKNTVLVAPGFGSPTSYLPGSGEYLTPNLVPGALSGGLVNQVGSAGANATGGAAGSSIVPGEYPSVSGSSNITMTQIPSGSPTDIAQGNTSGGYTEVTDDLRYSDGSLVWFGLRKPHHITKRRNCSMKSKKIVSLLLAGTMTAALLAIPAQAAETVPIRVNSYKGSTLEVGERSGLMIAPGGTEYTVTSSAPDTVAVEQVMTFWVAVAKAEGTAEITATATDGQTSGVTITVVSAESAVPDAVDETAAYSEVRQELIRLINQTRAANGVSELPVSEALMTAAQSCSDRRYTWHHAPEEAKAAADAGYPYGFGDNLTVFTGTEDAAQHALDNWLNSPGHRDTMLDPNCDCIGVGVTQHDGVTYCYMFVGIPNSVNFYA